MASSDETAQPKRTSVQLAQAAIARLDEAAAKTGLTRPRILEHLVLRTNLRDLVKLLKSEKPQPSRPGRPKQSLYRGRPMAATEVAGDNDD
jgi:hypothetical protein